MREILYNPIAVNNHRQTLSWENISKITIWSFLFYNYWWRLHMLMTFIYNCVYLFDIFYQRFSLYDSWVIIERYKKKQQNHIISITWFSFRINSDALLPIFQKKESSYWYYLKWCISIKMHIFIPSRSITECVFLISLQNHTSYSK